jgi:dihydroorotate dehydrogenase electron transfer subunit
LKDIKAKILSNKKVGNVYYKMAMAVPYIAKMARPGQFVQIKCSESFEPLLRRPFSIHRVNDNIEVLYEVVGRGTEILSRKKQGEFVDALGPLGNGFMLPRGTNREPRAIIIAGGIGVAPLVYLAEDLTKKKIKTVVLIGAKTKGKILCEKDFKNVASEVYVSTDDGSYGCKGLVSKLFHKILKAAESKFETIVYVCGPHGMLRCIADICQERNFECQVSLEENMACGIGVCLGCVVRTKAGNKLACKDGPVFNANELIW